MVFLQVVTKHFPRSHKLHKMFNRKTVKVSYSCLNNMSKIIDGHNKKVTPKPRDQKPKCNCRKKAECPMQGEWQVSDAVCKCDVTRPLPKKVHLWLTKGEWKKRAVFLTANYHLNTRDIPIRQHFQVTCNTWKCFKWKTYFKVVCFEMPTIILKYREEMPLVLI